MPADCKMEYLHYAFSLRPENTHKPTHLFSIFFTHANTGRYNEQQSHCFADLDKDSAIIQNGDTADFLLKKKNAVVQKLAG